MPLFEESEEKEIVAQGIVDYILYRNEESGWTVFRLVSDKEIPGIGTRFVVVCSTPGLKEDEFIRVGGVFVSDPKYGFQMKARYAMPVLPDTKEGIYHLLASGFLPVTKKVAKSLVDAFGTDFFHVLDESPGELLNVKGIHAVGRKNMKNNILPVIIESYKEKRSMVLFCEFFAKYGISMNYTSRIYNALGENAVRIVQEDPYQLVRVPLIGFLKADEFAQKFGIKFDDMRRVIAGVKYALTSEEILSGSCGLPVSTFYDATEKLLSVPRPLIQDAVSALLQKKEIVMTHIDGEDCLFSFQNYARESRIAERITEIASAPLLYRRELVEDIVNAAAADVERLERQRGHNFSLETSQRNALVCTLSNKISVITGGPGVGKTTIIRTLIAASARLPGVSVSLSAPTGRAAKRMSEATGMEAKTIHRLLKPAPKTSRLGKQFFDFQYNKDNKLPSNTIYIIDETSMLDVFITEKLLDAIPDDSHLVFVGDIDQLPPVGLGQVLSDIISSGLIAVSRLTHIFRQAGASCIIRNAHAINLGSFPDISNSQNSDFFFAEADEPEKCVGIVKKCVIDSIPRRFGFSSAEDIQVLAPTKDGATGTRALNMILQEAMNPLAATYLKWERIHNAPTLSAEEAEFMKNHIIAPRGVYKDRYRLLCEGDKVMQMKNNYELGVFNGETGRIACIDGFRKKVTVTFEKDSKDSTERVVEYAMNGSSLSQLSLAYACTIHKSQGSEYKAVVIPLMMRNFIMLSRKLLYTAVTRGKKLVVLVGQKEAIITSIGNRKSQKRCTKLKDFLMDSFGRLRSFDEI